MEKFNQKNVALKSEKKDPPGKKGIKFINRYEKHPIWTMFLFISIILKFLNIKYKITDNKIILPINPCSDKNSI